MTATVELPRWDLTDIYPALDSPEFARAFEAVRHEITQLAGYCDLHEIDRTVHTVIDDPTVQVFEHVLQRFNDLDDQLTTVRAYVFSFVATDSRNQEAQGTLSELQQQFVRLSKLQTRFTAWLGSLDVESLIQRSTAARDHEYLVRKTRIAATRLMDPVGEDLAAELSVTGGTAWSKLHGTLTSQMVVEIEVEGHNARVPMSVVRNLAHDPDRDTRRRAFEAEIAAWERAAVPLAAALNSIKGESNTLAERRGWDSVLDIALFENNIDRRTLDAMLDAAKASFPDFRRYFHAKARALNVPRLAWYDIFAPVGGSETQWDFQTGTQFMLDQFDTYSERLRDFASRALRERWIDAEPREGKRDGAFCMPVRRGESRVLTNYRESYDGISTVAHELGHAYHTFNLANRTPLQAATPMTLAETASIFCETIIREAALARGDRQEQLAILEASIQNACQVVVDIYSRYSFEAAVLERRKTRELSVDEFNALMLDSQRLTYGDGLDPESLHPYMWAVKGHYYSTGRPFYNFPYMFGLLFGLGLYAVYREDPASFTVGYDDLLSSTGLADAATLARRFGIDIQTPDFWHSSLALVRSDIDRFHDLIAAQ